MNVVKTKTEVHMTLDEYCTIRQFVNLLVERACLNDEQVGHVVMGIYADDLDREVKIVTDTTQEDTEPAHCSECVYYNRLRMMQSPEPCNSCHHGSHFECRIPV